MTAASTGRDRKQGGDRNDREERRAGRVVAGVLCGILVGLGGPAVGEEALPSVDAGPPETLLAMAAPPNANFAIAGARASAVAVELADLTSVDRLAHAASPEADPAFALASHMGGLPDNLGPPPTRRTYRFYKMKLLEYDRDLEVAGNDVVFKLKGPGKKRRLMTVELKF